MGCMPCGLGGVPVMLPRLVLFPLLLINKDSTDPRFSVDVRMTLHRSPESRMSHVQFLLSSTLPSLFVYILEFPNTNDHNNFKFY